MVLTEAYILTCVSCKFGWSDQEGFDNEKCDICGETRIVRKPMNIGPDKKDKRKGKQ